MTTPTRRSLRRRLLDAAVGTLAGCWNRLRAAQRAMLDALARIFGVRGSTGAAARIRQIGSVFLTAVAGFDRDARALVERWTAVDLPQLYRDGATDALARAPHSVRYRARLFAWTSRHEGAITAISAQYYADLINRIVEAVRRAQACLRAAQEQARTARGVDRDGLLEEYRLDTVVYRDESRHPAESWARAALGQQATLTTNGGALNYGQWDLGAAWFEVNDGPGCGWTTHDDPDLADGTIRSAADAVAHPLAHFNCVRRLTPRPDLNNRPNIQSGDAA